MLVGGSENQSVEIGLWEAEGKASGSEYAGFLGWVDADFLRRVSWMTFLSEWQITLKGRRLRVERVEDG